MGVRLYLCFIFLSSMGEDDGSLQTGRQDVATVTDGEDGGSVLERRLRGEQTCTNIVKDKIMTYILFSQKYPVFL